MAIRLGVERAIAIPLAVKNEHYTGQSIPPLNIGQGKVERLKRFLNGPGREIDLAASKFYTDSIVDVPVLEIFGHPEPGGTRPLFLPFIKIGLDRF